jgi:hypothetical protein
MLRAHSSRVFEIPKFIAQVMSSTSQVDQIGVDCQCLSREFFGGVAIEVAERPWPLKVQVRRS